MLFNMCNVYDLDVLACFSSKLGMYLLGSLQEGTRLIFLEGIRGGRCDGG